MIDPHWVARLRHFRPAWWLPGGHAQTLSAAFWKGPQTPEQGIARRIVLPDGDALVALDNRPPPWQAGDPAILMMHGLSGCARNPFLVRVTAKLVQRGVRVFRLNLRSCGAGAGLARLPYHAGRSGDLKAAVQAVIEWCREPRGIGFQPVNTANRLTIDDSRDERNTGPLPHSHAHPVLHTDGEGEGAGDRQAGSLFHAPSPLTLFGMSLSGNLLLKYLGEEGPHVPSSVQRAIAINPPIDLARSIKTLERPLNLAYDQHFVKALIGHVRQQSTLRPDFAALPDPLPRTLYDFDDRFTAPHGGYPDAAAYYQHASSLSQIPRIQVPTLILTAEDDPLVPVEMFHEQQMNWPDSISPVITRGGGHLGYVGRSPGDLDARWLDWRVVEFVTGRP